MVDAPPGVVVSAYDDRDWKQRVANEYLAARPVRPSATVIYARAVAISQRYGLDMADAFAMLRTWLEVQNLPVARGR